MEIEIKELKFLLRLLRFPHYQAPISKIMINRATKSLQREQICRRLGDRNLVNFEEQVTKFQLDKPGKSLLKMDTTSLPLSPAELKILQASRSGIITPSDTKLPVAERQELITNLIERGLLQALETKITQVWLTPKGQEFLCYEYESEQTAGCINRRMLTDYLRLVRQLSRLEPYASPEVNAPHPSDGEVLQLIRDLDLNLGTQNYLPIFHLRAKLQPPLSRQEVDEILYRLQRQDKIELSSLVDALGYTSEQISAGIVQDIGGCLFFISYS